MRSRAFDQLTLARIGLRTGEYEQACRDGAHGLALARTVRESARVRQHLIRLLNDTARDRQQPAVRELHEQVTDALVHATDDHARA